MKIPAEAKLVVMSYALAATRLADPASPRSRGQQRGEGAGVARDDACSRSKTFSWEASGIRLVQRLERELYVVQRLNWDVVQRIPQVRLRSAGREPLHQGLESEAYEGASGAQGQATVA